MGSKICIQPIHKWAIIILKPCRTVETSGIEAYQVSSVTQSCLTLCDPMICNMPGFPVLHYLPEFAHTHVHWVGDAIQLSRPLLSPFPPAFNLFQHQGLFQWGRSCPMSQLFTGQSGQSIGASALASVLLMTIHDWFLAPCLSQINSRSMAEQMSVLNTF